MEDYKFVVKNPTILNSTHSRKDFAKKLIIAISFLSVIFISLYMYHYYKVNFHLPFYIKNFKILNVKNSDINQIRKILDKYKGVPLKSLNLEKVYLEIKNIAWIKDVTIHKNFPSTLIVDIKEAKPVSIVSIKNKFYLLVDNYKLIKKFNNSYFNKGLYIITLENLNNFNKHKESLSSLISKIKKSNIQNISEIVMNKNLTIYTFKPNRKYIMDINNVDENIPKIKLLEKVRKLLSLKNRNFKTINLKYSNKIFIKL
jgi:cell division septal protein FtsQ